jgi:precorrin-2 methylase
MLLQFLLFHSLILKGGPWVVGVAPGDTPHLPLAALAAVSAGDLVMVPLSSSRSVAAP